MLLPTLSSREPSSQESCGSRSLGCPKMAPVTWSTFSLKGLPSLLLSRRPAHGAG